MSELPEVSRVVSVENHIMTVEVDSRYMHGLHPQQEAIERRNLELAEESMRDVGRNARRKMEEAVWAAILHVGLASADSPPMGEGEVRWTVKHEPRLIEACTT